MFSQLFETGRTAVASARGQVKKNWSASGISRRALRSVLIAGMLMTMVTAGPVTGSASAQTTFGTDCSYSDVATNALITIVDPADSCGFYAGDNTNELARQDARAATLALKDQSEQSDTTRRNQLQDIRAILYMKGKAAAIESLNNGSSEAKAKQAFRDAVQDHSSIIITNMLRGYEARNAQAAYLVEQTGGPTSPTGGAVDGAPIDDITTNLGNATVTLPNQDNLTIKVNVYNYDTSGVVAKPIYDSDGTTAIGSGAGNIQIKSAEMPDGTQAGLSRVRVNADYHPNTNEFIRGVITYARIPSTIVEVAEAQKQVSANGDKLVSNIYANYSSGEISSAELWDPVTLANEASTEYNSTGYYSFANSELAALGYTGDTNASHVVETQRTITSYENGSRTDQTVDITYEGTIFLTDGNMSLNTGQTYNPSNLAGTVYMTVADFNTPNSTGVINDTGQTVELKQQFTIVSATNVRTNESISTTSAQQKDYETLDTSRIAQEIDRLIAERNRLEQERQSLSSGATVESNPLGGLGTFLETTGGIALILLLGGAYVVLQGRDS